MGLADGTYTYDRSVDAVDAEFYGAAFGGVGDGSLEAFGSGGEVGFTYLDVVAVVDLRDVDAARGVAGYIHTLTPRYGLGLSVEVGVELPYALCDAGLAVFEFGYRAVLVEDQGE